MFELLIKVCVGTTMCYYSTPPITYETVSVCQQQAALISGLRSGQHPPGRSVNASFRCRHLDLAQREEDTWYEISVLAPEVQG